MYRFLYILFLFVFVSYAQDTIQSSKTYSILKNEKIYDVVYRGLRNPLKIVVPDAKSFKVYGEGLSIKDDGSYNLSPRFGKTVTVYVESILKNDSIVIEEHIFKIKGVPSAEVHLNGMCYSIELNKERLINAIISLEVPDYDYKHDIVVKEFEIFTLKRKKKKILLNVIGDRIDEETYKMIKELKKNTTLYISVTDFNQKEFQVFFCKIPPLEIKLLD